MFDGDVIGRVTGLRIYPIKSCKAVSVETLRTTALGFPYDRHWTVVSVESYRFVSQRTHPRMANIAPELPTDVLEGTAPLAERSLTIRLPQTANISDQIQIPLKIHENPVIKEIKVKEWTGPAIDEGDEAAVKLSAYLELPVRLFRFISDAHSHLVAHKKPRPVDTRFAVGYQTALTDGFPYLIVNEASYDALRGQIEAEFAMDRFRGNIVVRTDNAWEEDEWRQIQICPKNSSDAQPVVFKLVKPCKRCIMTCVDQATGLPGIEPLESLKSIRSGEKTGFSKYLKNMEQQGFFGWDAVTKDEHRISVDDTVVLLRNGTWSPAAGFTWTEYAQCALQSLRKWL